jgi:hypothetical protein
MKGEGVCSFFLARDLLMQSLCQKPVKGIIFQIGNKKLDKYLFCWACFSLRKTLAL